MPKCKKCAAAIRFIKMQSGKYMPVDPDKKPYREGGSEIFITDDGKMIHEHPEAGPIGFTSIPPRPAGEKYRAFC